MRLGHRCPVAAARNYFMSPRAHLRGVRKHVNRHSRRQGTALSRRGKPFTHAEFAAAMREAKGTMRELVRAPAVCSCSSSSSVCPGLTTGVKHAQGAALRPGQRVDGASASGGPRECARAVEVDAALALARLFYTI